VGSKAAVLAELRRALGDCVPDGVVMTPAAAAQVAGPGDKAHAALMASLPVATSYAVRSSALDEDAPDRSFAGQYETVLGVSTPESIVAAVRLCVGSGNSPRIDAYRNAVRSTARGGIAVVVQELILAERSGVAFTANPLSGRPEMIINASYGLGDVLVSGEITPDEMVLDREDGIVTVRLGSKRFMAIRTSAGVRRIAVPAVLQRTAALSDDQAHAVAVAARTCQAQLGFPVDMEWAISDGTVRVLQARPITGALHKASALP
jgi:pyruvate,water dikinase